jgi:Flp pilus assembly pilin Flp
MRGTHQWHWIVVAWARLKGDKGHALLEYGLILALISIVSIGVMEALGVDLSGLLDQGSSRMSSVTNP